MSAKKVVYYNDEQSDDFAVTKDSINVNPVGDDYNYDIKSAVWNTTSWTLYRVIATPVVWVYCRFVRGVHIKNRRVIVRLRGGCFFYGNHTQNVIDAFIPTIAAFPKRCDIITADDAVSVPMLHNIVKMLGAVPLPTTMISMRKFRSSIEKRARCGHAIAVYPEAHIWPYYNKIRDFDDNSFAYPVRLGIPAVPFTVVYKKRRLFRALPPKINVVIGEPVYPDKTVSAAQARKKMRDGVYAQMCKASADSYEHIKYVKKEKSI